MTYQRFEDLPVWKEAMRLAVGVMNLCRDGAFRRHTGLRDQLERAVVSVGNNVAEGFERGTTNELLMFLYIARGSAGEVRSMLHLLCALDGFRHLKSQISDLKSKAESCGRQLGAWAQQLQDSDIKGPRHLNESARQEVRAQKFLAELREKYPMSAVKPPE